MRKRILAVAGYVAAALTLFVALSVPFVLMGGLAKAFAQAGFNLAPVYSGGTVARTIERNGYRIQVYQPVRPRPFQNGEPFVQVAFVPASALPAQICEEIDLDGYGRPDVRVSFAVPSNPQTPMRGDVQALNDRYDTLTGIGADSYSRFLARTGDRIVLRIPLPRHD